MGSRIAAGQPITADFLNEQYTDADANNTTVTQTTATNLSTAYTIPASDAAAGTAYRVTCWGYGTWGSTQQVLKFAAALAGVVIGSEPAIASTAFSASAAFRWKAVLIVKCTATGTNGTWSMCLDGVLAESANAELPGTAADNVVPFVGTTGSTDVTQDTTAANTIAVQAFWASTTGGPAITCTDTFRERLD